MSKNVGSGLALRTPWILLWTRVALGPALIASCGAQAPAAITLPILAVAMLSDIFDGVIARRLNVATEKLRVADSRADAWFFCCVGLSSWVTAADVIRLYALPLLLELGIQVASYAYDLIRYRRITSLHAYSAKLWAISLYVAAAGLIAFHSGFGIWPAFVMGLICATDALAIKLILPGWRHDILSTVHAMRLRRAELAS